MGGVQWSLLCSARIAGGAGLSWGGQRHLLCLRCLAWACRRLQGVGGSPLARELVALVGCWRLAAACRRWDVVEAGH
jgi:hypothetical protein